MAEGRTAFAVRDDGWYVEPVDATRFLLDRETFGEAVYDPACGQGNVLAACNDRGIKTFGSDLFEREHVTPFAYLGRVNFLAERVGRSLVLPEKFDVITNPPYGKAKLAEAFIRHTLASDRVEKAAFFLNSKFLFGKARARGLFKDHPPACVYYITPRPSCPPGDYLLAGNKAGGGVENFVWIVWEPNPTQALRRTYEGRW